MTHPETTGLTRALLWPALAVVASVALATGGCNPAPTNVDGFTKPTAHDILKTTYRVEKFTDKILADEWKVTHGTAKVRDGKLALRSREIKDEDKDTSPPIMPLGIVWYDKPLPHEFKATWKAQPTRGPNDVNAYFGGDGKNPSGFEIVLGGLGNSRHFLGRWPVPNDMKARRRVDTVKPAALHENATYEITLERTAASTRVFLGGLEIMRDREEAEDLNEDWRYFAFGTWDNEVHFWDLTIEPILRGGVAIAP